MDLQVLGTVLATLITVLGGSAAWKYYEKRLHFKFEQRKLETKEDIMHINDLRMRIEKLEKLLKQSSEEKEELRSEIIKLTAETSAMKIELEYIAKENRLLRQLIGADVVSEKRKIPIKKKKPTTKKRG